ncbi:PGBD4 protein, partial [Polypterus senegalus]|nr:PGBD4 protein [Polypterus senegalus]
MLLTIRDCTVHEGRRTDPSWSLSLYELMAFISILFTRAATTTFGAVVDAWSELFVIPAIKDTMPRDRYQTIMGHLRFDNKDTRAERVKNDRFAAISDIWQRFVQNCISSYNPGQHITVDEQLFPTKVRCPFLQYITNKPDKFGIRFCIAADLETKYMCNATPYLGKDPSHPTGERLSEDVVMNLMEPFLDKGRTVTTGNFFTSLSLANRLLQRNTTLLGAINKVHRELPPPAKDTSGLEEFSTLVFRTDSTLLTVYVPKKKKSVCILSTMHQNVEIGDDRKKNPNTVIDYNNMKCAVDIMDQKVRAYSVRAGTRRWPVAVFYNMLDLAVMNAHILYKACTGSTEKRRVFLARLAEELRCYYLQEKALEKVKKVQLKLQAPRPPSPPGKKTQCQVLLRCHRNRSTNRCVQCNRYTCRKCRKEDPWVCGNC